jgi:hypothetical protein
MHVASQCARESPAPDLSRLRERAGVTPAGSERYEAQTSDHGVRTRHWDWAWTRRRGRAYSEPTPEIVSPAIRCARPCQSTHMPGTVRYRLKSKVPCDQCGASRVHTGASAVVAQRAEPALSPTGCRAGCGDGTAILTADREMGEAERSPQWRGYCAAILSVHRVLSGTRTRMKGGSDIEAPSRPTPTERPPPCVETAPQESTRECLELLVTSDTSGPQRAGSLCQ